MLNRCEYQDTKMKFSADLKPSAIEKTLVPIILEETVYCIAYSHKFINKVQCEGKGSFSATLWSVEKNG